MPTSIAVHLMSKYACAHPAAMPVKQTHAEFTLQHSDLSAECRLRSAQSVGRQAQLPQLRDV